MWSNKMQLDPRKSAMQTEIQQSPYASQASGAHEPGEMVIFSNYTIILSS